MSDDGEEFGPADTFFFPNEGGELDPKPIAGRLVKELDDFVHLRAGDAAVLFLMRAEPLVKAQRQVLGMLALPKFGGVLGKMGTWLLAKACGGVLPDFIMILDAAWWEQASPIQREALVYHELCHAAHAVDGFGEPRFTQDGDPIWEIKGHDVEEFNAVVERYGAWLGDLTSFIAALRKGGAI